MFDVNSGKTSSSNLIPRGTLCEVMLNIKEVKNSKETGGSYLNCELTVLSGPFEKRKIFTLIPDVWDQRNSEKWRDMGKVPIVRLAESCGLFTTAQPESYAQFNGATDIMPIAQRIQGARVVIRVGLEKGKDGNQDKNSVDEWGTPRPDSDGNKIFKAYHTPTSAVGSIPAPAPSFGQPIQAPLQVQQPIQAPAPGGFVQPTQAPVQGTPSWLKPPQ